MKRNKDVQTLVLAAIFAAISIMINMFFKFVVNMPNFGLPFYAIPIILGGVLLGPGYGALIGLVSDVIGVFAAGGNFLPLFMIRSILWGLIPGILLYKRYNNLKLAWVILVTYLIASLSNTFAMYIHFDSKTSFALLFLRLGLIPFNSVIMFFIIKDVYKKLEPMREKLVEVYD